jgi:hypothetical protein
MNKDESLKQEPVRAWFTANEFVEMAERRIKEWAKQADIPDLIAGTLGVSRGTAYDLMREALKEAAPVQEPVAWMHEWDDGERIPMLRKREVDSSDIDSPKSVRPLVFGDTTPPAQPAPVQEPVATLFGSLPVYDTPPAAQPAQQQGPYSAPVKEMWPVAPKAAAQPAVPDAIHHTDLSESLEYIQGWNDCRAEMLKEMKP